MFLRLTCEGRPESFQLNKTGEVMASEGYQKRNTMTKISERNGMLQHSNSNPNLNPNHLSHADEQHAASPDPHPPDFHCRSRYRITASICLSAARCQGMESARKKTPVCWRAGSNRLGRIPQYCGTTVYSHRTYSISGESRSQGLPTNLRSTEKVPCRLDEPRSTTCRYVPIRISLVVYHVVP